MNKANILQVLTEVKKEFQDKLTSDAGIMNRMQIVGLLNKIIVRKAKELWEGSK